MTKCKTKAVSLFHTHKPEKAQMSFIIFYFSFSFIPWAQIKNTCKIVNRKNKEYLQIYVFKKISAWIGDLEFSDHIFTPAGHLTHVS